MKSISICGNYIWYSIGITYKKRKQSVEDGSTLLVYTIYWWKIYLILILIFIYLYISIKRLSEFDVINIGNT